MTATLTLEFAPKATAINSIMQSIILTPMDAHAVSNLTYRAQLEAAYRWGAGRLDEVADLAALLPVAETITGATVTIDDALPPTVAQGA